MIPHQFDRSFLAKVLFPKGSKHIEKIRKLKQNKHNTPVNNTRLRIAKGWTLSGLHCSFNKLSTQVWASWVPLLARDLEEVPSALDLALCDGFGVHVWRLFYSTKPSSEKKTMLLKVVDRDPYKWLVIIPITAGRMWNPCVNQPRQVFFVLAGVGKAKVGERKLVYIPEV